MDEKLWINTAHKFLESTQKTGFPLTFSELLFSFKSSHVLCSFGPVLPFTAGLEGFWLAPDECSVSWAIGCGMIPVQSEMETQIWINQQGTFNMPEHEPVNKSSHCLTQILCNKHANRNNRNIYHSKNHIRHY